MLANQHKISFFSFLKKVLQRTELRVSNWTPILQDTEQRGSNISLFNIAKKYNTDKAEHNYMVRYESIFEKIRFDNLNILEIGVKPETPGYKLGTKREKPATPGAASLKTWKEYFPNSNIYGLDIEPTCKNYEEERIKIYIGNQGNKLLLTEICHEVGNFHIIIDDGSHVNDLTITAFNNLFPSLVSNGYYIIEDLACSYMNLDEHNVREKSKIGKDWWGMHLLPKEYSYNNNRTEILEFFEERLSRLDLGDNKRFNSLIGGKKKDLDSICFYEQLCIMRKA